MKQKKLASMLGLMALAAVAVTAQKQTKPEQQPPARPTPSMSPLFRTTTNAISVDVVVRTASGQFIPDLKLEEFVVQEDGVPQTIQSLSMSNGGRFLNLLVPQVTFAVNEGIIMPAARPVQDTSGRLFIFFIDDANIEFIETPRLRDLLHTVVKRLFHEGDLIAMVSSGMSSIEVNQTYDIKRIDAEISKVAGSAMSPHDIIQSAQTAEGPAGLRYQANNAFRTAMDMLDQLGAVSGKRKSFVWVSSGYDFNPLQASRDNFQNQLSNVTSRDPDNPNPTVNPSGSLPGSTSAASSSPSNPYLAKGSEFSVQDLNMELSLLAQAANRANVTFYAVDPRGLTTDMANLTDNFSDVAEWRNYLRNTQDSLRTLAELTGGFAITNTNSFDAGLKRIDNETSDYYMLGYTSSNPDPLKKDRKISVKVTRPGAVVTSWRQGYRLLPLSVIK